MIRQRSSRISTRRSGQTLVIGLIVLGVLLLVGFIFLGIVSRNIAGSGSFQRRTLAGDLAEAGVKYVHSQLLNSTDGADWRPQTPNPPLNPTDRDPDLRYLQGTAAAGGPDGLGAYSRVDFNTGRALVRVRYAPSDWNFLSNTTGGPLRNPGRARNYLIIEAIGRPGRINPSDPTTLATVSAGEYAKQEEFKLIAFASIGIIESARFITNHDRVTRSAEIGYPKELGAIFRRLQVSNGWDISSGQYRARGLEYQLGEEAVIPYSLVNAPDSPGRTLSFGGSLFSNADLVVHGTVRAYLNAPLGDSWLINGLVQGAVDQNPNPNLEIGSRLIVDAEAPAYGQDFGTSITSTLINNPPDPDDPSLDSGNPQFSTLNGLFRDGKGEPDKNTFARGVGRKDPPEPFAVDPNTGKTRWIRLTKDSGYKFNTGVNSGWFGFGQGIYVNNFADRQLGKDEKSRQTGGANESLVFDWLNPNNGQPNSGWQGSYYVPRGAYVQLTHEGLTITRDGSAPDNELYWKNPDGSNPTTGRSSVRKYKVGYGPGKNKLYVVNSDMTFSSGHSFDSILDEDDYAEGAVFNGVLYFEGNVRIRGVIPTDTQLTLVSGGTIYVEGSITKGIQENGVTQDIVSSNVLDRASLSSLMLIAHEYVTLNTTQFFGPAISQELEAANASTQPTAWNPLRMRTGGSLTMNAEVVLDPKTDPISTSPEDWLPFTKNYRGWGTNPIVETKLLFSHTMDDGPAPASFIRMDVNYGDANLRNGINDWAYLFPYPDEHNTAGQYISLTAPTPYYGLGIDAWQRWPKFESRGFEFLTVNDTFDSTVQTLMSAATGQTFGMRASETNQLTLRATNIADAATNDYLLARLALIPHDIRIEAAMFAEQGSFFVIPGNWFNPNPNDNRAWFDNRVKEYDTATPGNMAAAITNAARDRLEAYGAEENMPFYGEPPDVRISIIGSISENMPPPISQQAEWLRKWGWIPRQISARFNGDKEVYVPRQHNPGNLPLGNPLLPYEPNGLPLADQTPYVPNLIVSYDPMLATATADGSFNGPSVRMDAQNRVLPPMPKLPVSPTLAYFGEVQK